MTDYDYSSGDEPVLRQILHKVGLWPDPEEAEYWSKRDPITRFEQYLESEGLLDENMRQKMVNEITTRIAAAVEHAEAVGPPPLETLVEDVYETPPPSLRRQVIEALRIVAEKGEAEKVEGKFPL